MSWCSGCSRARCSMIPQIALVACIDLGGGATFSFVIACGSRQRNARISIIAINVLALGYRGPCNPAVAGVAGVCAGAGQPDEIHGIGYWRPMRKACRWSRRRAPHGTINDGNTVILGHVIRQAAGAARPKDALRPAELFDPLGMRNSPSSSTASGNAEAIEPDAGECARLGALWPALSR